MKIISFISIVMLSFSLITWAQLGEEQPKYFEKGENMNDNNEFLILNIDSIQSVYIIYARRRDSTIKIVSQKEAAADIKDYMRIQKGQSYDLKITSLLEHTAGKRHIAGIKYGGLLIRLEGGDVIWDLFVSENLRGLCFVPEP